MVEKILIVDDEPLYLRLLETNLVKDGYEVFTAPNGAKAVDFILGQSVNLVLMDVMMPVLDGFEACQRIRQFSNVPIIFLTAKTEERDRIRGLDNGGDDYIIKPFSANEMLARVRAVLRRSNMSLKADHERFFKHDELKIDLARAEVWRNEQQVFLSATEYRLLLIFAQNIGKVVTAEELLSTIWGDEYINDKEILWVSVARLRQKIEKDTHSPKHILTKSGVGYMMPE